MKKNLLIVFVLWIHIAGAQDTASLKRPGWLVYYNEHVIWFASPVNRKTNQQQFFDFTAHDNGLIVDYLPPAKYYQSIAKKYLIKVLVYDARYKKADYSGWDSIWILPAQAVFRNHSREVSALLPPRGVSFTQARQEVVLSFNAETNYNVTGVELVSNKDRRKLKWVKHYTVYPPH